VIEYDQPEADSLRWQVLYQKHADDRRISRNAPWVHPDNRMPDGDEQDEA
jgi:hypothetical protein